MHARISYKKVAPEAYDALLALERHVRGSGLSRGLLDLVYLRVSQQNGCAFCVDMHARDLRAAGETEERLHLLVVWRETSLYSARERAALAWAEAVTALGADHVGDAVYEEARQQLGERELVELTLAVATINAWNRLGVAFRSTPGRYQASPREPQDGLQDGLQDGHQDGLQDGLQDGS